MKTSIPDDLLETVVAPLRSAMQDFDARFPGESGDRQPVHTVYGGAHLFRAATAQRLGALALRFVEEYAPDFVSLARGVGLRGAETLPTSAGEISALAARIEGDSAGARVEEPDAWLAHTVHTRVMEKLRREPVEDFRLDFEDGYGNRPDDEEDACALSAAGEVARGMSEGTLPPFLGIRIKPFSRELVGRGARTLDLFLSALTEQTHGALPDNFVVTLPKVVIPAQVAALVRLFEAIESQTPIHEGALRLELMVETPQSIIDATGTSPLPAIVEAADGRCTGAHFGVYDYTASCSITAEYQTMGHPACDMARQVMQVALAGSGIFLSDGATNVLPVPVHRQGEGDPPLSEVQVSENYESVARAWRMHFADVRHSLETGYYQGWDLHPAQLVTRYAALYSFFLESLPSGTERLRNFVEKAAQATLVGDVFDDAATGQGLLNFFLRGLNCGAITRDEALATGLTEAELRSRSFLKILEGRRGEPS